MPACPIDRSPYPFYSAQNFNDRIAVMAALNIAHELIQLQRIRPVTKDETDRRLSQIQERISTALAAEPPVEPPLDASAEKV